MSEATSQQLVVFSLGSEEYALPIGTVHEIIRYAEPRVLASELPWIRGVIGLRGKIIPIFDLAARMGLATAGGAEPGKIVIAPSADRDSIEAIAKIGDRLVVLRNAEGLFAREAEPVVPAVA